MRRLAAVLSVVLVGYPLLVVSSTAVLALGAAALSLCALGILVAPPVLVGGMVLALGEYTLALWLADGPPRLAGAALLGVVLVLLLETADFGRRAHRATIGPGLFAAQLRSWAVVAALTGMGAWAAGAGASVASAAVRLPWAPAIAAAGVAVTLVAVALALSVRRLPPRD
ncbi:MAG: hypothetical protein DMD87_09125 [Candidatus Rokuibacteriota bacterium]|nr:MAG: hypothetical protein DMD87_09125 [Candidatus Rokubacteria bacterium]